MPDITFTLSDGYPSLTSGRRLRFRPRTTFEAPDGSIVYPSTSFNDEFPHDVESTVTLTEGPWQVFGLSGSRSVDFDVPAEGGELWPLIAANLAIPATTPAQKIAAAVADYIDSQGITPTTNDTVAGFVTAAGATKTAVEDVVTAVGDANYVLFRDTNGDPLPAGSVTEIRINTATGDIDNIIYTAPEG